MILYSVSAADKHGCQPEECVELAHFIETECPHLTFQGLMTVGRQGHTLEEGPNPDFQVCTPGADVDSIVSLSFVHCSDAGALLCKCPANAAAHQTAGAQYGNDRRLPTCCESQDSSHSMRLWDLAGSPSTKLCFSHFPD